VTLYRSKKIVITGPECAGKTSLAEALTGLTRNALIVPEYSRVYLSLLSGKYQYHDLKEIALGQVWIEEANLPFHPPYIFCDTSLLVIMIWSQVRYGKIDPWLEQTFISREYDLYILSKPDMPFIEDEQRENPHDRWMLYDIYKDTLKAYHKPYLEVGGPLDLRIGLVKQTLGIG
jgi:nicotinamide riboside kinase